MRQLLLQETDTVAGGIREMIFLESSLAAARDNGCSLNAIELSDVETAYPLIEFKGAQYAIDNVIDACKAEPAKCQVKYVISCHDTGRQNNAMTKEFVRSFF
jgi:hypothetical protein